MKIFYMEIEEEITSIIERIKKNEDSKIFLVVPRGSSLMQSLVSLKLLKKESDKLDKKITIITQDSVERNLASQVGFEVNDKLDPEIVEAAKAVDLEPKEELEPVIEEKPESKIESKSKKEKPDTDETPIEIQKEPKKEETAKDSVDKLKIHDYQTEEAEELAEDPKAQVPLEKSVMPPPQTNIKEKEEVYKIPAQQKIRRFFGRKKLLIAGIVFSVIAVFVLSYLFLPKAWATVFVKADTQDINLDIMVDKNIVDKDLAASKIAGKIYESTQEDKKTYSATGKKTVGTKATGKVTVSNGFDSTARNFPAGTKFTKSSKVFTADAAFVVPGASVSGGSIKAGSVSVNITASDFGPEYNLIGGSFTFSNSNLSATGTQTTGGTKKDITIISQIDVDNAIADLKKGLTDKANQDLTGKIDQNFVLIEGANGYSELTKSINPQVNNEAANFTVSLKAKFVMLAYSKNDFEALIKESVTKNIKDQSKTLVDVNYDSLKKDVATFDVDKGTAQMKIAGQVYVASQVNEDQLKKNLVGKSISQSNNYFSSFQEVDHADFRFWPKWYQKMPLLKSRIQIELKYQPVENSSSNNSTDSSTQNNQPLTPAENQKALDKLE